MRRILTLISALALLSACHSGSAKNDIAAMEAALTAADTAALAYVGLPTCGTAGAILCKQVAIEKQIGVAANAAYIAVKGAESAAASTTTSSTDLQKAVTAAQAALAAFQQIVATLPVKVN